MNNLAQDNPHHTSNIIALNSLIESPSQQNLQTVLLDPAMLSLLAEYTNLVELNISCDKNCGSVPHMKISPDFGYDTEASHPAVDERYQSHAGLYHIKSVKTSGIPSSLQH